jgi:hypothetical protein
MSFDVPGGALPNKWIKHKPAPLSAAPNGTLVRGRSMHRFGGLVFKPFDRVVDFSRRIGQQ